MFVVCVCVGGGGGVFVVCVCVWGGVFVCSVCVGGWGLLCVYVRACRRVCVCV